jgi:patatin-like phospholipase/acyl hydrolase
VKGIADSLHVFRTYDNTPVAFHPDDELGPASEAPIQKVCRATSAAPTYFDEVMIDKTYYYDGGLGYNNPAGVGHTELAHKEGAVASRSPHVPIRVFVSIGTGGKDEAGPRSAPATTQPQSPKEGKRKRGKMWMHKHYGDLIHRLEKNAVEVLRVDKDMRTKSTMGGWPYFRWTGGEELALIRLDKWKKANKDQPSPTQTKIEGYIDAYMQNRNEEISRVAKILVETRRKRVRHENGDMWQRFTYCSQFACHCKTDKWQDLATVRRLTAHLQSHNGTIWDMSTVSRHGPEIVGGPR